jgi:hypothetical protein
MDAYSQRHVSQRIVERIKDVNHQKKIVELIKRLLTMDAPAEAIGEYQWHINLPSIGRVVMRGHSVRTVLSFDENYPGSTEYKISNRTLIRA